RMTLTSCVRAGRTVISILPTVMVIHVSGEGAGPGVPAADTAQWTWSNAVTYPHNGNHENIDCLSWKYLPLPRRRVGARAQIIASRYRRRGSLGRYCRLPYWQRRPRSDPKSWSRARLCFHFGCRPGDARTPRPGRSGVTHGPVQHGKFAGHYRK